MTALVVATARRLGVMLGGRAPMGLYAKSVLVSLHETKWGPGRKNIPENENTPNPNSSNGVQLIPGGLKVHFTRESRDGCIQVSWNELAKLSAPGTGWLR